MKKYLNLIKDTYFGWNENDPWAKSAIIAYYALFSLPSLLIITVHVAGIFFGKEAVQGRITNEIGGMIGEGSADAIQGMLANAALENSSTLFLLFGIGVLIFGATGVFFQLQKALNDIWSVRAKKDTFKDTLKRRATAFGMVMAVGLLMLISLVVSSVINALSEFISFRYSELSLVFVQIVNFLISQIIVTALFAAIFTVLPDVKIRWKTNLIGAFVTALLFMAGKYLIGFYFAKGDPASVYGAASSVVLILLWVYYTCLILFFGAEFTVQWALLKKLKVVPTDDATLSYKREMEELKAYKNKIDNDKKKIQELAQNPDK